MWVTAGVQEARSACLPIAPPPLPSLPRSSLCCSSGSSCGASSPAPMRCGVGSMCAGGPCAPCTARWVIGPQPPSFVACHGCHVKRRRRTCRCCKLPHSAPACPLLTSPPHPCLLAAAGVHRAATVQGHRDLQLLLPLHGRQDWQAGERTGLPVCTVCFWLACAAAYTCARQRPPYQRLQGTGSPAHAAARHLLPAGDPGEHHRGRLGPDHHWRRHRGA